jgi:hypothetical protein
VDEGTGFGFEAQPTSAVRDVEPKAEPGALRRRLRAALRSTSRYRRDALLYAVRGTAYGAGTAVAGLIVAWWTSRH